MRTIIFIFILSMNVTIGYSFHEISKKSIIYKTHENVFHEIVREKLDKTNTVLPVNRSFTIDFDSNTFVKDGEPFRYVSGSLHYWRVHPGAWRDRLRKFRYAGLNAVETYVDWASHEPEPGEFNFTGPNDLEMFIKIAQEEDLLVILRVGPYICAEKDMGGLPYWLLRLYPFIRLRSSDRNYIQSVDKWLLQGLLPRMRPLLYGVGGPIIMVQVENEYGNYFTCDYSYTSHLRTVYRGGLGEDVLLFTTDNGRPDALKCGKIPEVYATVDFGVSDDPLYELGGQRLFEPKGPLVVSEYYCGWFDRWGEEHHTIDPYVLAKSLDSLLAMGVNVNMYMFHGGTNFGLTTGAVVENGVYKSYPTSYDYDAPISEAGDMTFKYELLRNVIGKHLPLPTEMDVPSNSSKAAYGEVSLTRVGHVLEMAHLLHLAGNSINAPYPLTFEDLGVASGIVVYQTTIECTTTDPSILDLGILHDRGYVFINGQLKGLVSRSLNNPKVSLRLHKGDTLSIIVESMGRVNVGLYLNDLKGLTSNVSLNYMILKNWTMIPLHLTDRERLSNALNRLKTLNHVRRTYSGPGSVLMQSLRELFMELTGTEVDAMMTLLTTEKSFLSLGFYQGTLSIPTADEEPRDTFIRMDGWTKGVAWVNEFCIGRFWPAMGPQLTLYVPKELLHTGDNNIILLELEEVTPVCGVSMNTQEPSACVTFVDTPQVDGPVPEI